MTGFKSNLFWGIYLDFEILKLYFEIKEFFKLVRFDINDRKQLIFKYP